MRGLQPGHAESPERLHARFLATVNGQNRCYEAIRTISEKDLAMVEEVTETSSRQTFIRKTFQKDSSFGLAISGLFNEVRFPAKIGARYAATAIDYGVTPGGQPFLVFEQKAGDLRSLFDPQKPRDVYQEALKLSTLLLYLNLHGIVHRDIKPSNILVDHEGNYLLADFSLALYLDEVRFLPPLCFLNGTPAYMPPESRSNRHNFVPGYGQDIYAMGMTILETVTGRFLPRNFSGKKHVSSLLGIRNDGWMRFFRRALERDGNAQWQLERLALIVSKATCYDPQDRYANGARLFQDIYETLRPGQIPVGPIVIDSLREALRPPSPQELETAVARPQRTIAD